MIKVPAYSQLLNADNFFTLLSTKYNMCHVHTIITIQLFDYSCEFIEKCIVLSRRMTSTADCVLL